MVDVFVAKDVLRHVNSDYGFSAVAHQTRTIGKI